MKFPNPEQYPPPSNETKSKGNNKKRYLFGEKADVCVVLQQNTKTDDKQRKNSKSVITPQVFFQACS